MQSFRSSTINTKIFRKTSIKENSAVKHKRSLRYSMINRNLNLQFDIRHLLLTSIISILVSINHSLEIIYKIIQEKTKNKQPDGAQKVINLVISSDILLQTPSDFRIFMVSEKKTNLYFSFKFGTNLIRV